MPSAPTGLTATAGATDITLVWKAPADTGSAKISGYVIEESANGRTAWSLLDTVTVTTYKHTGVLKGERVFYRVFALNKHGSSPASTVVNATVGQTTDDEDVPSAPTGLTATAGATDITLVWEAPADSGSARITSYRVQQSSDGSRGWVDVTTVGPTTTSYVHTSVKAGAVTYYRVFAANKHGDSPASNVANAERGPDTPGAPTALGATAGSNGIALTWAAPAETGSAALTGYRVERSADGTTGWTAVITLGTVTTYVHTGVGPNTTIHYRVFAINKHGDSPASNIAKVTTGRALPTAPVGLTVAATDNGNALAWRAPADSGSAAITGYRIEQSATGVGWTPLMTVAGDITSYVHTSAAPGRTTHYRVIAINARGDSPPSNVVNIMRAANPPSRPSNLRANASGSVVVLTWRAPSDDGGAEVTGYSVEVADALSGIWTVLIDNTESTETSYTHRAAPGSTKSYRVFAINSAGHSASSNIVRIDIEAVVPDPPLGVGALARSHNAIGIAWDPPVNTGGSPVTSYRIETSEDGAFWSVLISNFTATSTLYQHTDLQPAQKYYYRVFAINKAGRSGPSEVVSAKTLADLPGAPQRLVATPVSPTQINLTWDEPRYTGGVALTGYEIETSADGDRWRLLVTTDGDETTYRHRELTPATSYYYRILAKNEIGLSKTSRVVFAQTSPAMPDAPHSLTANARSSAEIYLTWMKPEFDGGSRITGYRLESSTDDGSSWSIVRANTGTSNTVFTHTGLTRATLYRYRVAAINKIGASEWSEIAETKTFAVIPSAPLDLEAEVVSSSQIDLVWIAPDDDGGAPITRYQIEVTDDDGDWIRLADVDRGLEYAHTDVEPGQTWTYRVKARNEAGYGPPSNPVSATTDDPIERTARVIDAILPRFAMTAVNSSLRAISTRIDLIASGKMGDTRINVMGGREEGDLRDIANGSVVTQPVHSGGASVWASADLTGLEERGTVDWSGEIFSIHAGLDGMLRDGVLVGIAGSRSRGGFNFMDRMTERNIEGTFNANLTSMNPYLAWIQKDVGVWASTGFGWGAIDISDPVADRTSVITSSMFAIGGFRHILSGPIGDFRVRAEGVSSQIVVAGNVPPHIRTGFAPDHIDDSDLRMRRGRLMLDWTIPRKTYGEYHADIHFQGGVRYDYNELDTGLNGTEIGGGIRLIGPIFRAQGNGRMFIHPDYQEWGIQGLFELRSRQNEGLGLEVRPSYGNAQSGVDQLWKSGVVRASPDEVHPQGRINVLAAYRPRGLNIRSFSRFDSSQDRIMLGAEFTILLNWIIEGGYDNRGLGGGLRGKLRF